MLKAVAIGRLKEVVVARQTLVGGSRFFWAFLGKRDGFCCVVSPPEGGGKDEEFSGRFRPQKGK